MIGLLFLVASLPGAAIEQLLDPAAITEITNNGEQKSTTEEKQEEHFLHFRNKIQSIHRESAAEFYPTFTAPPLEQTKLAAQNTEAVPLPLYLHYCQFLI